MNQQPRTLKASPASNRRGLTLIELLVTIVILVTVLAGALPLLSPNNNARKIREASRQLTTLLSQAQAQAARDGRPVGVAFKESEVGGDLSGMALEAYTIAEPAPFTGFSEYSRVSVDRPRSNDKLTYGDSTSDNPNGNKGEMFDARYRGAGIWELAFSLYGSEDPIPPRMLRNGDVVNADGNYFLIVDDPAETEGGHRVDQATGYVLPTSYVLAIWLNDNGQQLVRGAKKPFSIGRQPMNTSEQPLQFPRGIGIDLEASGADGLNVPSSLDNSGATTVGIMFSPNGSISTLYRTTPTRMEKMEGVEQIYLLLGTIENGNGGGRGSDDYNFSAIRASDAAELAQRRSRINWLNADSRWVTLNRVGRIVTADNNVSFDPNSTNYLERIDTQKDVVDEQRRLQIGDARNLAKQMTGSTGR